MDILGVAYRTRFKPARDVKWQNGWEIKVLRRDQIIKLVGLIHLQSEKKRAALQQIVDTPLHKIVAGDPRIEEIRKLYWECNFGCEMIGAQLDISKGQVHSVMRRFGIPTRNLVEAWDARRNAKETV